MTIGSPEHKAQFIENLKKETAENIWKNELHLIRLNDELGILRTERAKVDEQIEAGGKSSKELKALDKQLFNWDRNIEHQLKEIARVEEDKKYNEYLLKDLLPRYENPQV